MDKLTHAVGSSPFARAAGGPYVGGFKQRLRPHGEVNPEQCHRVSTPFSIAFACADTKLLRSAWIKSAPIFCSICPMARLSRGADADPR